MFVSGWVTFTKEKLLFCLSKLIDPTWSVNEASYLFHKVHIKIFLKRFRGWVYHEAICIIVKYIWDKIAIAFVSMPIKKNDKRFSKWETIEMMSMLLSNISKSNDWQYYQVSEEACFGQSSWWCRIFIIIFRFICSSICILWVSSKNLFHLSVVWSVDMWRKDIKMFTARQTLNWKTSLTITNLCSSELHPL